MHRDLSVREGGKVLKTADNRNFLLFSALNFKLIWKMQTKFKPFTFSYLDYVSAFLNLLRIDPWKFYSMQPPKRTHIKGKRMQI